MTTRRQHYVPQMLLRPWCTAKGDAQQLWALRRCTAEPFLTETKNVAVQKDFYRLTESFPDDIKWVRSLGFTEKGPDGLRELNEGWIRLFEIFWSTQDLRHHVHGFVDLITELDRQLIERQEDYYCLMEDTAVKDMEALKRGDVSFFRDDHRAVAFCFFLMNQYFRTKKLHDHMRKQFDSDGHAARFVSLADPSGHLFDQHGIWCICA